jgi:hypothetical protein
MQVNLEIPQNARRPLGRVDQAHVIEMRNCGPSDDVFVILPDNIEIGPVKADQMVDFQTSGEFAVRNSAGVEPATVSWRVVGAGTKSRTGFRRLIPADTKKRNGRRAERN